jgi:hypothetical protein
MLRSSSSASWVLHGSAIACPCRPVPPRLAETKPSRTALLAPCWTWLRHNYVHEQTTHRKTKATRTTSKPNLQNAKGSTNRFIRFGVTARHLSHLRWQIAWVAKCMHIIWCYLYIYKMDYICAVWQHENMYASAHSYTVCISDICYIMLYFLLCDAWLVPFAMHHFPYLTRGLSWVVLGHSHHTRIRKMAPISPHQKRTPL